MPVLFLNAPPHEEFPLYAPGDSVFRKCVLAGLERNGASSCIVAHWIVNAINCKADKEILYKLSSHPDVQSIGIVKEVLVVQGFESSKAGATLVGAAPHVIHVNADDVWNLGYNIVDGKKILVK